ncbi:retropepsin-like aspartic protease [Pedobacter psychroterrae]|uniref:Aspartyl protease n=1 Tax=Pedobacter psychroterrae TaxID=2530453 RepID=A0A4R0NLH8_9SPHI|nr:retropepsin-like aspartic protease [Pedobacter psychroterrae]TCD00383.1 hypothetical protein EZ437_14250 [Pedobacter psychroterrae]
MRIFFAILLLTLSSTLSYSQEEFTLNQGGTSQKNYFTEIEYEDIRWAPIINVTINGKTYRFLLDTGAGNTITKKLFDELTPEVIKKIPISDANNQADSLSIVNLKEITIGNLVFNNIPSAVPKDSLIFDCLKIDGFIGSNMLRNSIVQFSSKTRKIVITDQPEKLNLHQKQGTDMYLTQSQNLPLVTIAFFGKGSGTIPTLFDTGFADFFNLALFHFNATQQAEVFNVQAKSRGRNSLGLYGFGTDTTQYRLQVPELHINGTVFKNVNHNTTVGNDSIIGARLLDYGIVTVDYKHKKFYFEPFETSFDLSNGWFPVTIIPKDDKIWIGMIWDEQLKDKISLNDQVLAIDGVDYTNVSTCEIMVKPTIFNGASQATLTLRNANGATRKVTIYKK